MPVDPEALLHFPIAPVAQRLLPHVAVLYALSVGLGQDPVDARQLDYVDPQRALRVLPSMAVVLGHPGFWLADPRTGVDAVRLVHGEQGIVLHHPIPVGADIVGRTRVTGVVDKGPGRGALLSSAKQGFAGDLRLATTPRTPVLRGDGGCGGPT
ncbi:MAG: MaoC family dehydratase N-terminal domain-containing protein, partial [Gemmatimonadaceae bacterium]|nr:MaoC family dehydratase N-terminal domain-containing protein [Acetobacteraceae bacterium]